MAATAPIVISGVSPSLLNSPDVDARERGARTLPRAPRECRFEGRRHPAAEAFSGAAAPAGRVSRRAGAIRAIEPVTAIIAATRSAIVGCVAKAPSCAPSIIMASCPAARPGMTLRPSMR